MKNQESKLKLELFMLMENAILSVLTISGKSIKDQIDEFYLFLVNNKDQIEDNISNSIILNYLTEYKLSDTYVKFWEFHELRQRIRDYEKSIK